MIGVQTMIDMVVDEDPLGIDDGLLDRLQLVGDIKAGFSGLDHRDHCPQVAFGAFQPGDEGWVACVDMRVCHTVRLSPPRG